jgi:hypothetical protein
VPTTLLAPAIITSLLGHPAIIEFQRKGSVTDSEALPSTSAHCHLLCARDSFFREFHSFSTRPEDRAWPAMHTAGAATGPGSAEFKFRLRCPREVRQGHAIMKIFLLNSLFQLLRPAAQSFTGKSERHGCSGPRAGIGLSRHEPARRNPCR